MRRKKKRRENVHANRICVWNYEIVGDVNSFPTDGGIRQIFRL